MLSFTERTELCEFINAKAVPADKSVQPRFDSDEKRSQIEKREHASFQTLKILAKFSNLWSSEFFFQQKKVA